MRCFSLGVLTLFCACIFFGEVASAASATTPQSVVLDQGGRKITYYRFGGKQYREAMAEELNKAPTNESLCVQGKLKSATDSSCVLYGTGFAEINFKLASGVMIAEKPGCNIMLGGKMQDGGTDFLVENVASLPGDLDIFKEKWQKLDQGTPSSKDFFRLAWWVDKTRSFSISVLSPSDYETLVKGMKQAYAKAIALEEASLGKIDKAALKTRLDDYKNFVESFAGSIPQGQAAWHVDLLRNLLHSNKKSYNALAGEIDGTELKSLSAAVCMAVGNMRLRYLGDEAGAKKIFLTGAGYNPNDAKLSKKLNEMGMVFYAGGWMNKSEAERRKQREARSAREKAAKVAEQSVNIEREKQRAALLSGKGSEKIYTVVDPLLCEANAENLIELSGILPKLSEDAARYALWSVTALPHNFDSLSLLKKGLTHPSENVCKDAIDLLSAWGSDGVEEILSFITEDTPKPLQRHAVLSLRRIPGPAGIDALIRMVNSPKVPAAPKNLAFKLLALETGEKLGKDSFGWKQWWKKEEATFERKMLDQ